MSIPKEPRQQMINLMYLFLTAMLALNVSREVLNAFILVDEGINHTIDAIEAKNSSTMEGFNHQMSVNAAATKPHYEAAQEVNKSANDLYKEIQTVKERIVKLSGGRNEQGEITGKKNVDIPSQVLIFEGKGEELQKKIQNTRELMLNTVKKDERQGWAEKLSLSAEDPKDDPDNRSWAEAHFEMVPTVASVALLTKLQNDVRSAQADILNYLFSQIGRSKFRVDVLQPKVIENTNYVMSGQKYKADIFVSAYSSSQKPYVFVGKLDTTIFERDTTTGMFKKINQNELEELNKSNLLKSSKYADEEITTPLTSFDTILPPEMGMGKYIKKPTGSGIAHYEGAIRVQKPSGLYEWYPFRESYQVAQGAVVVSPEKMNVLYIGPDNPVSISVPGFKPEDVSATIGQGSLIPKGGGSYIARVTTPGNTKISVSVKLPSGDRKHMGAKEFRVKRVPDPVAMVGREPSGKMSAGKFKSQLGVEAVLQDFEFDLKFKVVSFDVVYRPARGDALSASNRGALWSSRVKQFISRAKPGDLFFIDDITVRGPSGNTRKLPGITYELQ